MHCMQATKEGPQKCDKLSEEQQGVAIIFIKYLTFNKVSSSVSRSS